MKSKSRSEKVSDNGLSDFPKNLLYIIGGVKAQGALDLFLKDVNVKKVAEDYKSFIRKGEPGTERLLIFVLQKYGSRTIAVDFFNCGNSILTEAARRWAKRHDYSIPYKKEPLRWGSSGR